MPDWKNASDYAVTEKLDGIGWAWEFLRRNPKYRDAYKNRKPAKLLKPLAESEQAEAARRRWRLIQPLQDPAVDTPPKFDQPFPYTPLTEDDLSEYFIRDGENDERLQRIQFATFVFDVRQKWSTQVDAAKSEFERRQAFLHTQLGVKPDAEAAPHRGSHAWRWYLVTLDAELAGAGRKEVVNTLEHYTSMVSTKTGSTAEKRYDADYAKAREYRETWFRFLSLAPPPTK